MGAVGEVDEMEGGEINKNKTNKGNMNNEQEQEHKGMTDETKGEGRRGEESTFLVLDMIG